MNESTDQQLLRDYSGHRSEAAFSELVRRHIDLVHSAAFRMTGEAHSAQDVTQAVFVELAQNAARLAVHPVLSGWLHTTARNLAAKNVRAAARRQNHEQEAAAMNELLSSGNDVSWEAIAPHLDAALGELSEPDRDALLLRYFEKKSAQEMAERLGISNEAAQKRVSRAVERLREFFAKRGVTIGASGLAVVISAHAVQAAPVGLALTISTAAALTGTTLATTASITATKAIAMTILQKTIVTATVAVLAGAGIYEARQASQLRDQVQTLQQQAPLEEQAALNQEALTNATSRAARLRDENEWLSRNTGELLKLRAEVGLLRNQAAELVRLKQELHQREKTESQQFLSRESATVAPADFPKDSWVFAGYATPEAALQTWAWAMGRGDKQTMLNSLTTDAGKEMEGFLTGEINPYQQNATDIIKSMGHIPGYKIADSRVVSESEVMVAMTVTPSNPSDMKKGMTMLFRKVGNDWKISGPVKEE